ncbi:hypothetical protein BJV78DRAFT_1220251 [Lactifluus subvellereus]|nr:hypothetical protein BJV78DRAFT_1220251 [Lactifluus subvellereus]
MSIPIISARTPGQVTYDLDSRSPVPTLAHELHEHINAGAWAARIPQLIRLSNRYNKPVLETIWFIAMFIATLAVPTVLRDLLIHPAMKKTEHHHEENPYNFITFAVAVGIVMLFTAPYVLWKCAGQARATTLVKKWEAEDARPHAPGAFVPVWSVKLYCNYSSITRLTITTPEAAMPSYFHPAAYMPSWINGPIDPGAGNGFPAANQGFQRPAMYGEPPMYGNYNGGADGTLPPYVNDGMRSYSDEKV